MAKSSGTSGCMKGLLGCGGVGCGLVVLAALLGATMAPQLKTVFEETVERGLQEVKQQAEDNPIYTAALEQVLADPRITERLGEPIEAGFPSNIGIQRQIGGVTVTSMEVKLTGSNGDGRLEFRGSESDDGEVTFELLRVWIGAEGIDFLER